MSNRCIPLSAPAFNGNEVKYLQEAVKSTWVSSQGPFLARFEKAIQDRSKVPYAVAVMNGTAALHTALMIMRVEPNDEVLVPSLSFVATANVVRYCGAHPVFMDVDWDSWTMDPIKVKEFFENQCVRKGDYWINRRTKRRIRALLPVHTLGHSADMDSLNDIARRYKVLVLEDACEALGALYKGKSVGGLGDMGCFSFNGNKVITCGGGGMIVTRNERWAKRSRYLITQAKDDPREYIHHEVGYNYRLTNIQAALGCAQMEQLTKRLAYKTEIAQRYREAFKNIPDIRVMPTASWATPTYWLFTIRLLNANSSAALVQYLADKGVESRRLWRPLHLLPMYQKELAYRIDVSETLYAQAVSLPSSPGLSKTDQAKVIKHVLTFIKQRRLANLR